MEDVWKDFKFQIGDLVQVRGHDGFLSVTHTATVVTQILERCSGGAQRMYSLQGWSAQHGIVTHRVNEPSLELAPPQEERAK